MAPPSPPGDPSDVLDEQVGTAIHFELELRFPEGLEPLPLVSMADFFARSGLEHQLAESGADRLVYVVVEDLDPSQLQQLLEEILADRYHLAFEQPADNRLVCTLAAPQPPAGDGGPDGDTDGDQAPAP